MGKKIKIPSDRVIYPYTYGYTVVQSVSAQNCHRFESKTRDSSACHTWRRHARWGTHDRWDDRCWTCDPERVVCRRFTLTRSFEHHRTRPQAVVNNTGGTRRSTTSWYLFSILQRKRRDCRVYGNPTTVLFRSSRRRLYAAVHQNVKILKPQQAVQIV